jgi:hypothetical protein
VCTRSPTSTAAGPGGPWSGVTGAGGSVGGWVLFSMSAPPRRGGCGSAPTARAAASSSPISGTFWSVGFRRATPRGQLLGVLRRSRATARVWADAAGPGRPPVTAGTWEGPLRPAADLSVSAAVDAGEPEGRVSQAGRQLRARLSGARVSILSNWAAIRSRSLSASASQRAGSIISPATLLDHVMSTQQTRLTRDLRLSTSHPLSGSGMELPNQVG